MCNIVQANADLQPFSGDKIEAIARNLASLGVGVVLLTGGEPFLRQDIVDIVKIFKSHGLEPRLQTAGLTSKLSSIKECMELGATDINVSLDSLDEKLSDYINGVPGSWRKAIETISAITYDFPQTKTVRALGCVLSPLNISHVISVLDFATNIGWYLSLVPVHINNGSEDFFFRGKNLEFASSSDYPERVAALVEELKKRKRKGALLFDSTEYLDSIVDFVKTGVPSWRKNSICDSPDLYFAIKPDGSYAPCCDHSLDENIFTYDDNFVQIFKTKAFRDKTRAIAAACPGCNFGSYPEISITFRSGKTFIERTFLQLKQFSRSKLNFSRIDLFEQIDCIKERHNCYRH